MLGSCRIWMWGPATKRPSRSNALAGNLSDGIGRQIVFLRVTCSPGRRHRLRPTRLSRDKALALHYQPAVDLDALAGDVARPIGGEETDKVCDIIARAQPAAANLRSDELHALV